MCDVCNQSQPNKSCPACCPEPEEELIQCDDCLEYFDEQEMDDLTGSCLCPDCLRIYKAELALDYNEYDE